MRKVMGKVSLILMAALLVPSCVMTGLGQGHENQSPPDMTADAAVRTQVIQSLSVPF